MKVKNREAVYGLAALGALGGVTLLLFALSKVTGRVFCPLLGIFGIPCPFCGMTRGFFAIFRLDFAAAWRYNALAPGLFAALSAYGVCCLWCLFTGRDWVKKINRFLFWKPVWILGGGLLAASWVVNLIRYGVI